MDARKELTIYQVGDIVIRIHQDKWHGYKTQGRTSSEKVLYGREFVLSNNPRVVNARTIQVEGTIVSDSFTASEHLAYYHSLENTITDIIAYQVIDCCHDEGCCGCSKDWQDLMWWQTVGLIQDIDVSESGAGEVHVSISLLLQSTWQPVNRFIWSWANRKRSIWADETPSLIPNSPIIDTLAQTDNMVVVNGSFIGDNGTGGDVTIAQSFIVPTNGILTQFVFKIRNTSTATGRIIWAIYAGNTTNGPSGSVLAYSAIIPVVGGVNTVTLPVPINLVFGQTYFIVMKCETIQSIGKTYLIQTHTPSTYSSGQRWLVDTTTGLWVLGDTDDWLFSVSMGYNYINEFRPYPKIEDILDNCGAFWVRRNWNPSTIIYNPDLWAGLHRYHRSGYPATGYGMNWSIGITSFSVTPKRNLFSVEPTSLYAFSNLPNTGGILISVNRYRSNIWRTTREDTSIDLAAINSDLSSNGYTGLLGTDVVIVGDTPNRPGLIIRNGAIIPNVAPKTVYPGEFPGELGPAENQIKVILPISSIEFAQIHTFRRL